MKRLFAFGLAVLLMVGLLTACGSSDDNSATSAASTASATSTGLGMSVNVPDGWTKDEKKSSANSVAYSNGDGRFNIGYAEIPSPAKTLDEYVESTKKNLSDSLKNLKFGQTTKLKLGGQDAVQIDYSAGDESVTAAISQYIVINDNKMYVLTASATKDKFADEKGDFQTFLNSVKFQ